MAHDVVVNLGFFCTLQVRERLGDPRVGWESLGGSDPPAPLPVRLAPCTASYS